jgi:type II secretory pathway pseudopilin PulG
MIFNQNKKQGVTIIELLIVIAAAVSLIAAGLVLFSDLQNSQRVKDASANVSSMFASINDLYKRDGTASLNEIELINAGVIPNGMTVLGTDVKNVWGGEVDFAVTGTGSLAFDIIYTLVPTQETCVDFVESQRSLGWDNATIGGVPVVMSAMTTTQLITDCLAGGADTLDITFFQD